MDDLGLDRGALCHVVGVRKSRLGRFALPGQADDDRLQLPRPLRAGFRDPLGRKVRAAPGQPASSAKPLCASARQRR
jgi:hypothetical protein